MSNPKKKARYQARIANASRSVLAVNKLCIVNLNEPYFFQTTFHHGNYRMIRASERIASALCDIPHRWTIYLAAFCEYPDTGKEYIKSVELATQGLYKAESLTSVIREHHTELVKNQNPNHLKSSGWIAFPYPIEYSEKQASDLFESAIKVSADYQNVKPPEDYTP